MPWWAWMVLGFTLLAGEMLTPGGLYLLFIGVGALIVGVLAAAGVAGPSWSQWLLFTIISVLSLATLRSRLARSMRPRELDKAIVGETIELTTGIAPDGVGQGRFRGSVWKVHNAGSQELGAGTRCRVEGVRGITLTVGVAPDALEEMDSWTPS